MNEARSDERVTFLIAGVQKAGTSALFDYLKDEPGLALPDEKEIHFFDDETQDWGQPHVAGYHARFPRFDGRLRGEATPIYVYWRRSLERIASYNPAMKLIVLLRDPVQRAWSHWRMEVARGAETEPFSWCIREGRQRLFEVEPWGWHREFSYVERGFYGEQMAQMQALFPGEQVLVLKAEELRADPKPVLAAVRGFLSLPEGNPPRPREVHVGREAPGGVVLTADDVSELRRIFAEDQRRLLDLIGIAYV
jgi:hypothetical protein